MLNEKTEEVIDVNLKKEVQTLDILNEKTEEVIDVNLKKEVQTLDILNLEKIRNIQKQKESINKEHAEIGNMEFTLNKRKQILHSYIDKIFAEEQEISIEIQKKYGKISIDIETGQFNQIQEN